MSLIPRKREVETGERGCFSQAKWLPISVPVLIGRVKQFRLWSVGQANQMLALPRELGAGQRPANGAYQVGGEFLQRQGVLRSAWIIMNATAWEREIGPFDFLLASDFWPHGEVSRKWYASRTDLGPGPAGAPFL